MASLQGRPIVLNFWAGLCPACRAEMPQFQLFYEELSDDILLLGIDIGPFRDLGSNRDAEALLLELGVTYPAVWIDDGSVPRQYGVVGMPTILFIKSNGEIFEKVGHAIDARFLTRTTLDMMAAEAEQGS